MSFCSEHIINWLEVVELDKLQALCIPHLLLPRKTSHFLSLPPWNFSETITWPLPHLHGWQTPDASLPKEIVSGHCGTTFARTDRWTHISRSTLANVCETYCHLRASHSYLLVELACAPRYMHSKSIDGLRRTLIHDTRRPALCSHSRAIFSF